MQSRQCGLSCCPLSLFCTTTPWPAWSSIACLASMMENAAVALAIIYVSHTGNTNHVHGRALGGQDRHSRLQAHLPGPL